MSAHPVLPIDYSPEELASFVLPSRLTDEQQDSRRGQMTGTRAAMALGESDFGDERRAYREIVGLPVPDPGAKTEFGTWSEGMQGLYHSAKHGVRLVRPQPATVVHPDLPWLCASLDWVAVTSEGSWDYLVEAKATDESNSRKWGAGGTDAVPAGYHIQGAIELACTGLDLVVWQVLIGQTFREFRMKRDLVYEHNLLVALEDWWNRHVIAGVEPENGDERLSIETAYPREELPALSAEDRPDLEAIVTDYRAVILDEQAIKVDRERIEAEIAVAAAGHCGLQTSLGFIPYRWHDGYRRADAKLLEALARRHGATEAELDECFYMTAGSRRVGYPQKWTKKEKANG